ncbi:MAG: heparinase II/III family protein [Planctomycetes bacterium]|nr:heparinase II/III family protein [Planctomycetota bacterium]
MRCAPGSAPRPRFARAALGLAVLAGACALARDIIPPRGEIRTDRPRVLLRPAPGPHAISLDALRAIPRDADWKAMAAQLAGLSHAAAKALLWRMTGDTAAADAAIARLRAYEFPGKVDTFHTYFRLLEFGLAYDWLYGYAGFGEEVRAEVRRRVNPLARQGIRDADDHMFHNYIWMSAGGVAIWALATAGEDAEADGIFDTIRRRFNDGLYPAWRYLDGLPSEPMGYWSLYVLSPGILALLGAQSAFERDLVGEVAREDGDWLARHVENLVASTLPDLRYIPWGDLQGGPNGGVTHEMAGVIDAAAWALRSGHAAHLSDRIARRRGLARFHGETGIFYFLYTRALAASPVDPVVPPTSFYAGARHGGHFIARSGWDDGGTIVAFTVTDHFGDHHHYDQGSFVIYRNGLLAVDPPVYRRIRGPQQRTDNHNTLLIGAEAQRPVRGQWFRTIEDFRKNLDGGRKLETGDILFHEDAGPWAGVAGEFSRAYREGLVARCVRQLLFIRPDTVVTVDRIEAPGGGEVPAIEWLLHVPSAPIVAGTEIRAANGKSWLRVRPLLPGGVESVVEPIVEPSDVGTQRVRYRYAGAARIRRTLVHVLEIGDGSPPAEAAPARAEAAADGIDVTVRGTTYRFAGDEPFDIRSR